MVPRSIWCTMRPNGAPRARGDGPDHCMDAGRYIVYSPLNRVWSRPAGAAARRRNKLPAHAGMIPSRASRGLTGRCAPSRRRD